MVPSGCRTRSSRFGPRDGVSLVELMIALAIFSVLLFAMGEFFLKGSRAMTGVTKNTYLSARAPSVLDRIVSELVSGRFASMTPPIPNESTWMRFQKVATSGSPPVYGNPIQIELVGLESSTPNGIDDDGDGLIDESAIRIWEDVAPHGSTPGGEDIPIVLAENLTGDGLKFTRDGSVLTVDVAFQTVVERGDPPTVFRLQSGVRMRNSN